MKNMLRALSILAFAIALIAVQPARATQPISDASGTITTGGTSQQIQAAVGSGTTDAARQFLVIQNREATDHLYVNFGAAASTTAAGSFDIAPGTTMWFDVWVVDSSVNIIGPTTGDKFTCKYR